MLSVQTCEAGPPQDDAVRVKLRLLPAVLEHRPVVLELLSHIDNVPRRSRCVKGYMQVSRSTSSKVDGGSHAPDVPQRL